MICVAVSGGKVGALAISAALVALSLASKVPDTSVNTFLGTPPVVAAEGAFVLADKLQALLANSSSKAAIMNSEFRRV